MVEADTLKLTTQTSVHAALTEEHLRLGDTHQGLVTTYSTAVAELAAVCGERSTLTLQLSTLTKVHADVIEAKVALEEKLVQADLAQAHSLADFRAKTDAFTVATSTALEVHLRTQAKVTEAQKENSRLQQVLS